MRIGIVKTTDGSVFRYDNPEFFDTIPEHRVLAIITAKNEKVAFPLYNVINFSIEGANDEND